ncbi:Sua5/YciO/YrdC/YwlC family protein [Buchnera aphidicola]|uniref:Sua5/YciO/YrdC/YwlC family protein n=1 Tax=Buchnera aphidicola TaxID=9 RepID=UPI0031B861F5
MLIDFKKDNNFLYYIHLLKKNKIIAYPTESVFGLGCNPDNEKTVMKLIKLKKRKKNKGFILISDNYNKFIPYIDEDRLSYAKKCDLISSKHDFVTFLVPAKNTISQLITGYSDLVAIRIVHYSILKKLCYFFKKPIISTSANISGMSAARSKEDVLKYFGLSFPVLFGDIGKFNYPSKIINIMTGECIRDVK